MEHQLDEVTDPQERWLIERFLIQEAKYADCAEYDKWEGLLEPDMLYWVPRGLGEFDPDVDVSIINDNRARIATRMRQLKSGSRHSQTPASPMRRQISNIVATRLGPDEYFVESNFSLFEMAVQSRAVMNIWAGTVHHKLRRTENGLKIFYKKVMLINGDQPIPSLAFII